MRILLILISLPFLFSCISQNVKFLDSFNDKGLYNKYKYGNIPILLVTDTSKAPVKLRAIKNKKVLNIQSINKNVVAQVFVDEKGHLTEIFLIKSVHKILNDLVINSIKKSKYSIVLSNEKSTPYYFFVSYLFDSSKIIEPVLNGYLIKNSQKNPVFKQQHNIELFKNVDQKPISIFKKKPIYPELARLAGITGTVVITVVIDEYGNVIDAVPFKSIPLLKESAIEAAYLCKFKPGFQNGKRVKVLANIPFRFHLK